MGLAFRPIEIEPLRGTFMPFISSVWLSAIHFHIYSCAYSMAECSKFLVWATDFHMPLTWWDFCLRFSPLHISIRICSRAKVSKSDSLIYFISLNFPHSPSFSLSLSPCLVFIIYFFLCLENLLEINVVVAPHWIATEHKKSRLWLFAIVLPFSNHSIFMGIVTPMFVALIRLCIQFDSFTVCRIFLFSIAFASLKKQWHNQNVLECAACTLYVYATAYGSIKVSSVCAT